MYAGLLLADLIALGARDRSDLRVVMQQVAVNAQGVTNGTQQLVAVWLARVKLGRLMAQQALAVVVRFGARKYKNTRQKNRPLSDC